jgi:hypothetical protein
MITGNLVRKSFGSGKETETGGREAFESRVSSVGDNVDWASAIAASGWERILVGVMAVWP